MQIKSTPLSADLKSPARLEDPISANGDYPFLVGWTHVKSLEKWSDLAA